MFTVRGQRSVASFNLLFCLKFCWKFCWKFWLNFCGNILCIICCQYLLSIFAASILSAYFAEYLKRQIDSRDRKQGYPSRNCLRRLSAVYCISETVLPGLRQPPFLKDDPDVIYFMADYGTSVVIATNF